jgi:hypothetical protein
MPPDFPKQVVELVAKRAAYLCSNPDSGCLTVGANADPAKATVAGEAAHIFGARAGIARYRSDMIDSERAASTNAIWVCGTCHSRIDRDEITYQAELLFMWKIRRESATIATSGKAGEVIRSEFNAEEMRSFVDVPIYARQLILTKPPKWEYYLTAELMLHCLKPVIQKRYELEADLYTIKSTSLQNREYLEWIQAKLLEVKQSIASLAKVLAEFGKCWGPAGTAGNAHMIKRNCELFAKSGQRFLEIAEEVKFVRCPAHFDEIGRLFVTGVLHLLNEFQEVPQKWKKLWDETQDVDDLKLVMVIELPVGWRDQMAEAIVAARREIESDQLWDSVE